MKLSISAELNGVEIVEHLLSKLKERGIEGTAENIKVLVKNPKSPDKEVEVSADSVRFIFNKE